MNQQQLNQGNLRSRQFLEALFFRYFKDHEGYIELRLISKESGACLSKFYHLDDINDQSLEEIRQLNATHHIYFGVNPRPLSKGKKQADIKDVVCLWVDIDGKDLDGGKEEALKRAGAFPFPPTIIIDSGHGYHCYWAFRAPKVGLSEEERLELKQTLSGVIKELGGDRSKVHLDACLRLPGTLNIKEAEPAECRILGFSPDKKYKLEDFAAFKDVNYKESEKADGDLPAFGSRQLIISLKEPAAATADVKRLEVDSRTQNRIITGALLTAKGADKTRSGRDMSILCRLISSDYDYSTIKSIFLNPLLGCSNRISGKGEATLQWDVRRALKFVQEHKVEGTPQSRKILEIKNSFSGEERRRMIANFITSDLFSGQNPAGYGLKDKEQGVFYLFDKDEKLLMSLESIDFYCYMRTRYGISKKDFDEIKDVVMAEIWGKGKEVKPHKFSYFDGRRFILYVSDHASQVYRLDGEKIELCDNGVDGVFFEDDPALSPYTFDPELEVVNYFMGDGPAEISDLRIRKSPSGLSISQFLQENCLLNKFLVERVNFIQEKDNIVSPVEQKLLLIVYFYSLFFESILHEKPIACFVGKKASGKSFIAVSVGKILFGEKYESCHFPEDTDDLKTALGRNYYLVFDNMDQYLSDDETNVLCVAATGGTVTKRRLYTDSDEVRYTPHCFLVITSREPKFKRDDLVSRLLLFNTQKIGSPIARSALFSSLLAGRNSIITEVLVNLNTVVKILRLRKDFEPRCISRIADWEVFGRKVCGLSARFLFRLVLQMMNEKKDKFAIEDDYLYLILTRIVYEKNQDLTERSASDLYSTLLDEAKDMKLSLSDFQRRYKNSRSMGMRLANIREELAREFGVEIFKRPNGQRAYTFLKKFEEEESSAGTDLIEAPETVITSESGPDSSNPSETEPVASPVEADKPKLAGKALRAKIEACKRRAEKNRAAQLGPGEEGPERPREDEY